MTSTKAVITFRRRWWLKPSIAFLETLSRGILSLSSWLCKKGWYVK